MAEITRKELILALVPAGATPRLSGVDLTALDMTRLDMNGSNLRGSKLAAATLREAILRNSNCSYTDFQSALLVGTDFDGANLTGANLSGANLSSARLTNANLSGATLNSANLTGANMSGAKIDGLRFNESTTWPDGKKGSQGNPNDYISAIQRPYAHTERAPGGARFAFLSGTLASASRRYVRLA